MRRRPSLGQRRRRRLPHTMRRSMRQVRLTTPVLKLVAETVGGERLPELSDQESEVAHGGGLDTGLQRRVQWNVHINRVAVFVFRLTKTNATVAHMLPPKPGGILTSARRKSDQVDCETRLRSEGMACVELFN